MGNQLELPSTALGDLAESRALNHRLLGLLREQGQQIGFLQCRLEWAKASAQDKAIRTAAAFLHSYFGPIDETDGSAWSSAEAEAVHRALSVAAATPHRPEEVSANLELTTITQLVKAST